MKPKAVDYLDPEKKFEITQWEREQEREADAALGEGRPYQYSGNDVPKERVDKERVKEARRQMRWLKEFGKKRR